jgi:hypothetical protein
MVVASQLGTVLAAETPCHFNYDADAINKYIIKNVPESDMSFGSMLQLMIDGQTDQFKNMTPSAMTALCSQTARVAKFNGFIH